MLPLLPALSAVRPYCCGAGSFWHLDASRQRTQELFSRLPLQLWCCQSLSFFALHSLKEDDIGVFQRSLESVLSSMLSCSLAIESYVRSQSFLPHASSQKLNGRQVVRLEPFSLSLGELLASVSHP